MIDAATGEAYLKFLVIFGYSVLTIGFLIFVPLEAIGRDPEMPWYIPFVISWLAVALTVLLVWGCWRLATS